MNTPTMGVCCACGYVDEEETPCQKHEDRIHCVHWWDGFPTELDWAEYEFATVEYDYQIPPRAAERIRALFKRLYDAQPK